MNLDDMIAAERSTPAAATQTQASEVWRSIEDSFVSVVPPTGAPVAAAKASTLGKLGGALTSTAGKLLLATALVTGGVVGANQLSTEDRDDTPAAEPSSSIPAAAATPVPPAAAPPEATPTPEPEPRQTSEAAAAQQPEKKAPEAKPARVRAGAKPATSLKEELALIRETQSAIRSGAHARALTLARRHAKTYPNGAFVEDREALRALALCKSGNTKATLAASSFLERWPKSMHRSRIEAACE